jgi:chromosome partitioning protein
MITLVASEKGGTGKTTLATNLAAIRVSTGAEVLLVNADSQGSAMDWGRIRDEVESTHPIYCAQIVTNIKQEVLKFSKKFKDIIIDFPGKVTKDLSDVMTIADVVVHPAGTSQYDIWSASNMDQIAEQVKALNEKLRCLLVLNRVSANPFLKQTGKAVEVYKGLHHLRLIDVIIRERTAFCLTAEQGLGVTEATPKDKKAIQELMALYEEVYDARTESERPDPGPPKAKKRHRDRK